jgi:hypothetical protein
MPIALTLGMPIAFTLGIGRDDAQAMIMMALVCVCVRARMCVCVLIFSMIIFGAQVVIAVVLQAEERLQCIFPPSGTLAQPQSRWLSRPDGVRAGLLETKIRPPPDARPARMELKPARMSLLLRPVSMSPSGCLLEDAREGDSLVVTRSVG